MATIKNFLKKYGNANFEEVPFCDADILFLNTLSYADFSDYLKKHEELKTELVKYHDFRETDPEKLAKKYNRVGNDYVQFVKATLVSKRYGDLEIGYMQNVFSVKKQTQFFAMTFRLDNKIIVMYRGTDNTIVGRKEDFNMAFMDVIPAQIYAKKYLKKILRTVKGKVIVSGHSKGGNLAYYAFYNVTEKEKKRVSKVYNLDGPGFKEDLYDYEKYKDQLLKIVPSDDIVGILFDTSSNYTIIGSSSVSLMAHDPLSWMLTFKDQKCNFLIEQNLTPFSAALRDTINIWAKSYDEETVEEFVDFIFDFLGSDSKNTIKDVIRDYLFTGTLLKKQLANLDEQKQNQVRKMMKDLFKLYFKNLFKNDTKITKK